MFVELVYGTLTQRQGQNSENNETFVMNFTRFSILTQEKIAKEGTLNDENLKKQNTARN